MHRWSTDQVDPKDRLGCWREVRPQSLSGVTAELVPEPAGNSLCSYQQLGADSRFSAPDFIARQGTFAEFVSPSGARGWPCSG